MSRLFVTGEYEEFELDLVRMLVKPGMRALDVGAHIGMFTLLLCELVGEAGNVVAMEPDPACFQLLGDNVFNNGYAERALCVNAAAASETGTLSLYGCQGNSGDNRLWDADPSERRRKRFVHAVRIDDQGLADFDFVKIDTQGFEVQVLRGMELTLEKVSYLLMEYWPWGIVRAMGSPADYLNELFYRLRDFRLFVADGRNESLRRVRQPADLQDLLPPGSDAFVNLLGFRS